MECRVTGLSSCVSLSLSTPLGGLVVKTSTSRAEDPGFDSRSRRGDFSGSSHTSDSSTPVALLPGAWSYRVSVWQVGPVSVYCDGRLSHKWPVWLGVHGQAGGKDCARRQWISQSHDLWPVTRAIQWLASQRDAQITHAIVLTDSMNLLQKVESGMGSPYWHTSMHSLRLQRLLWIYCPGHAGVSGNERADRLASTADITALIA